MGDTIQQQIALDTEIEQAVYFHARERRKSLFDPTFELFRTFTIAESAAINMDQMPTRTENLTLRTSIVFEAGTSEGLIFEFGSSTAGMAAWITNTQIGFTAGSGIVGAGDNVTGIYTIPGGLSFETGELIKLVFSVHPFLGKIEVWLDGERVIQQEAIDLKLLNFEWSDAGGGSYGFGVNGTINLNVPVSQRIAPANFVIQEPLSIYADQLPRQFDATVFDPLSLSPACWYDPFKPKTVVSGKVSIYPDQSINGNTFTQQNVGARPSFSATGLNSKPALTFIQGGADYMQAVDSPSLDITTSLTCFAVVNVTGTGIRNILAKGVDNGYRWRIETDNTVGVIYEDGGNTVRAVVSTSTIVNGTNLILSVTINPAVNVTFRANGVSLGSITPPGVVGINENDFLLNLAQVQGFTEFFDGAIGTNGIFPFIMADADLNKVGNSLANDYGLTWTNI